MEALDNNNQPSSSSKVKDVGEKKIKKQKALEGIKQVLLMSEKYSAFYDDKLNHALKNREGKRLRNMIMNQNNKKDNKEGILSELKYFKGNLRDYQVEGLVWLKALFEHGVNGILADEMGLGKTVQIIALLAHLYEKKMSGPFLIVVPLSTLPNWSAELERFAPELPVVVFYGYKDVRPKLLRDLKKVFRLNGEAVRPIVVTTTHMISKELNTFHQVKWKYMVVDEAHNLKNHMSKVSQEMRMLKCANKLLLTGTPLQNNLDELWGLLNFIMPLIFKNIDTFSSLLILEDLQDDNKILQEEKSNNIISTLHKLLAPFMLRRLKNDVLLDIVPKKEVLVYCPLTKLQKTLYKYVLEKNLKALSGKTTEDEEVNITQPRKKRRCTQNISYSYDDDDMLLWDSDEELTESTTHVAEQSEVNLKDLDEEHGERFVTKITSLDNPLQMYKKIVNHPFLVQIPVTHDKKNVIIDERLITESGKMLVLDLMLVKLKETNHKILIFSTLKMMLDLVEEYLEMKKYTFCRLDGYTSLQDRKEMIDEFNTNPDLFIFLISTRAGGLGLNLTGADTVIFFDRDWNPQVDLQAQDRCHRIGQTKPVMVYSLITRNTIDEQVVSRGQMKRRLEKIVIKDGKFKDANRKDYKLDLKELQQMLTADKSESVICNGKIYADEELEKLLDRSELYKEIEMSRANSENKENQTNNT